VEVAGDRQLEGGRGEAARPRGEFDGVSLESESEEEEEEKQEGGAKRRIVTYQLQQQRWGASSARKSLNPT
jgi:hypothetical protein